MQYCIAVRVQDRNWWYSAVPLTYLRHVRPLLLSPQACCRCSNDSAAYNPSPRIMEFDGFIYKLHVVHGGGNEPDFPASGNVRLVGVAYPKAPPPPGVRQAVWHCCLASFSANLLLLCCSRKDYKLVCRSRHNRQLTFAELATGYSPDLTTNRQPWYALRRWIPDGGLLRWARRWRERRAGSAPGP